MVFNFFISPIKVNDVKSKSMLYKHMPKDPWGLKTCKYIINPSKYKTHESEANTAAAYHKYR